MLVLSVWQAEQYYCLGWGGSFSQLQLIFTNLELNEWVECEILQLIISSAISVG